MSFFSKGDMRGTPLNWILSIITQLKNPIDFSLRVALNQSFFTVRLVDWRVGIHRSQAPVETGLIRARACGLFSMLFRPSTWSKMAILHKKGIMETMQTGGHTNWIVFFHPACQHNPALHVKLTRCHSVGTTSLLACPAAPALSISHADQSWSVQLIWAVWRTRSE